MTKKLDEVNKQLLKGSGSVGKNVASFARIRSFGDKNTAWTHDGNKVERQKYLYAEGYGLVRCLDTTMHFIYSDPSKVRGRWTFMCSCGSIGGIVGYKDLGDLVTPEMGEYVLICVAGLTAKQATGIFKHADGSTE